MDNLIFINKPLIKLIKKEVNRKYYSGKHSGNKLKHSLNNIIEAILKICKTGSQWNFFEYKNIHWSVIRYHFDKWTTDGIFIKCWKQIYNIYQKKHKYKSNLKQLSVDCTFIKSINGKDCIGSNPTDRGRNATKLSIIVDLLGVPVGYVLDCANKRDDSLFEQTINNKIYDKKTKSNIYADKGYSDKNSILIAKNNNLILLAPNKKNFKKPLFPSNIKINKYRYVVEASNSWIKGYKKIILRYESKIKYFNSFILLGFSMLTNRKFVDTNI